MHEGNPLPDESLPSSSDRERFSTSTPAVLRLSRLLQATSQTPTDAGLGDVRETIRDFVRELKDEGLPPERVLVRLKSTIGEVRGDDIEPRRRLFQQVITWCIEEYYRSE
jgi:hypothetical protein